MIWVILFIGLTLRLVNLDQSLWLDEAIQAMTARGSFLGVFRELQGDFHPPLYHLLTWLWVRIFGASEVFLRLPSVLFGVGTVFVVYLIAQEVFAASSHLRENFSTSGESWPPLRFSLPPPRCFKLGGETSLLAALFMATAPFHIYYSQEARMYAMATFFASLSMYFFLRVIRKENALWFISHRSSNETRSSCHAEFSSASLKIPKQVRNDTLWINLGLAIPYIFSTTLLLYADYFGLFILLAQVVASLIILKKRRRALLPCCFVTLFLFLPCLPMFLTQIRQGFQVTQVLPEWGRIVNLGFFKALPLTFVKFALGRVTIFNKKLYAIVVSVLFLVYGVIIGRGFLRGIKNKKLFYSKEVEPHRRFDLIRENQILFWFFLPILSAWLISLFIPNYQPFRLLFCLPAFYLLLALGISKFSSPATRVVLTIFILGVNLVATGIYFLNPFFHREDWRGTVSFIESRPGKKTLALLPSASSTAPYFYYSQGKVPVFGNQDARILKKEDQERFLKAIGKTEDIWYVDYLRPVFDPEDLMRKWLVEAGYAKIKEVSCNQILLLHYKK